MQMQMQSQSNHWEDREREKEIERERVGGAAMLKSRSYFHYYLVPDKHKHRPCFFLSLASVALIAAALLISVLFSNASPLSLQDTILCSLRNRRISSGTPTTVSYNPADTHYRTTPTQLIAVLHYATSTVVPQQSLEEIKVTFEVLRSLSPCNFLVFGLGQDSLMWSAFNPGGTTIFLEEDPKWVQSVLKDSPTLHAHMVRYTTQLSQADDLLSTYSYEPNCLPGRAYLRGNHQCRLALTGLPEEVYETEWDLIMIDAPRGYFPEAPGRMGAIFSAAVMARARKGPGVTHVFLHDVDRKVEKTFAEEFLCKKYLVKHVGRLWHFEIPPAAQINSSTDVAANSRFC
ncbi:probable methyltransferase At1g27930 [Macadamia integrifolia]|uniref:probable methyltransferase At1g27930 n=1 Tax=Macadamia integrifolia TaxID=60698 RepID=UPI001C4FF6BA|nr:probable methyltransferase At1g27930 [Macadamia integrifolia]